MANVTSDITDPDQLSQELAKKCLFMRGISSAFKCCGLNNANDMSDQAVKVCCSENSDKQVGCGDKVIDLFKKWAWKIFLICNIVFLIMEVLFLIAVPYLIYRFTRAERKYKDRGYSSPVTHHTNYEPSKNMKNAPEKQGKNLEMDDTSAWKVVL